MVTKFIESASHRNGLCTDREEVVIENIFIIENNSFLNLYDDIKLVLKLLALVINYAKHPVLLWKMK